MPSGQIRGRGRFCSEREQALRKTFLKVGPWDPSVVVEVDKQLGLVREVSPLQLKGPRFCCTQQWVIRGFKMAGNTIRRGKWQDWGPKQSGR